MSHASCLVVTDTKPTKEELQEILLPWHEYECTGIERYLVDVDRTDEVTEQFNNPQRVVVLLNGEVLSRYDDRFYQKQDEFGGKEFSGFPTGAIEREMPADEARTHGIGYATMGDAAAEWCGARMGADGRWYMRTNPDKKWDWWQIGGRFSGKLAVGYGPAADPKNQEVCGLCRGTGKRTDMDVPDRGCNGCQGSGVRTKWPTQWAACDGNQARWSEVNRAALTEAARVERYKDWDKAERRYAASRGDGDPATFGEARRRYGTVIKELQESGETGALWQRIEANTEALSLRRLVGGSSWMKGAYSREEFVAQARGLTAYAIVKDGKWHQNGQLGWFGASTDEDADWDTTLDRLLTEIRPDQWVTVIDYHI